MLKPVVAFCLTGFSCILLMAQQNNPIRIVDQDGYVLEVKLPTNHSSKSEEALKVFVGENYLKDLPPITGKYSVNDSTITFRPKFGFQAGMEYTAIVDGDVKPFKFVIPEKKSEQPTKVSGFFPSNDTLPANLLKVYIQFSQPMSEGMAYENIHVLNEQGDTVFQPFLQLQPELWDLNNQRLTLWLDPGRVKRDLGPNLLHGAPLEEGQHYRVCISKNWADSNGAGLGEDFIQSFFVKAPDREMPNVNKWKINAPAPDTKGSITIHFGESLDFALAPQLLTVVDRDGQIVEGKVDLIDQETKWQFVPIYSWKPGLYKIKVKATLEDLAGNTLNRLFDRDLENPEEKNLDTEYYWIPLDINE